MAWTDTGIQNFITDARESVADDHGGAAEFDNRVKIQSVLFLLCAFYPTCRASTMGAACLKYLTQDKVRGMVQF